MNKRKKSILLSLIIMTVIVGFCTCGFIGYKFYIHEINQNERISNLSSKIDKLSAKLEILENEDKAIEWSEEGYNYLAIGNSITVHGLASYWWDDDRGMAASCDENDYVHRVSSFLKGQQDLEVITNTINMYAWEANGSDREEFLGLLNPYLSDKLDLVTIQLGENASNLETWETDFEELIYYVKEKALNVQIVVVGDFWSNSNRDELKEKAANICGVKYVSLDGIKDNKDYWAGVGTQVEDSEGNLHLIEHSGVAKHPGDKGMEAIAQRIISVLP